MKISQAGIEAIKRHEGLRLHAYLDSAGVPTIGHGHTAGVFMGQHIDEATAEAFLRSDLAWCEAAVNNAIRVPITQAQYDACVSLCFNIGEGAFAKSTLVQKLNAGDIAGAADEFLKWNKITVNGEKVPLAGLTSRRAAERKMFLSEATEQPAPAPAPEPQQVEQPNIYGQEHSMPIPIAGIAAALLPELIASIPKLGKIFGSGSVVSERNQAAVEAVLDVVQTATKTVNAQAAVEAVKASPEAQKAAEKAIEEQWFTLTEAGGGGIAAARKADAAAIERDGPWWQVFKSPSFLVAFGLLPLVYMVVGSVVGLFGQAWPDDVRSAIANGVVGMVIGALAGYYFGQTTSRNRTPAA